MVSCINFNQVSILLPPVPHSISFDAENNLSLSLSAFSGTIQIVRNNKQPSFNNLSQPNLSQPTLALNGLDLFPKFQHLQVFQTQSSHLNNGPGPQPQQPQQPQPQPQLQLQQNQQQTEQSRCQSTPFLTQSQAPSPSNTPSTQSKKKKNLNRSDSQQNSASAAKKKYIQLDCHGNRVPIEKLQLLNSQEIIDVDDADKKKSSNEPPPVIFKPITSDAASALKAQPVFGKVAVTKITKASQDNNPQHAPLSSTTQCLSTATPLSSSPSAPTIAGIKKQNSVVKTPANEFLRPSPQPSQPISNQISRTQVSSQSIPEQTTGVDANLFNPPVNPKRKTKKSSAQTRVETLPQPQPQPQAQAQSQVQTLTQAPLLPNPQAPTQLLAKSQASDQLQFQLIVPTQAAAKLQSQSQPQPKASQAPTPSQMFPSAQQQSLLGSTTQSSEVLVEKNIPEAGSNEQFASKESISPMTSMGSSMFQTSSAAILEQKNSGGHQNPSSSNLEQPVQPSAQLKVGSCPASTKPVKALLSEAMDIEQPKQPFHDSDQTMIDSENPQFSHNISCGSENVADNVQQNVVEPRVRDACVNNSIQETACKKADGYGSLPADIAGEDVGQTKEKQAIVAQQEDISIPDVTVSGKKRVTMVEIASKSSKVFMNAFLKKQETQVKEKDVLTIDNSPQSNSDVLPVDTYPAVDDSMMLNYTYIGSPNPDDDTSEFPTSRWGSSLTRIGDRLYLFGGDGENGICDKIDIFDTERGRWEDYQDRIPKIPLGGRAWHSGCAIGNLIFVFGGEKVNQIGNREALGELYTFDTEFLTWYAPATRGPCPGPRSGHAVCTMGNHMYIFGGNKGRLLCNELYSLNTATYEWTRIHVKSSGKGPCARVYTTMNVFGDKIVMFGGNGSDQCLNDLYIFDTKTGMWHNQSTYGVAPCPRTGHGAIARPEDNKLFIFGGWDYDSDQEPTFFDDMHVLDLTTWRWSRVNASGSVPAGRCGASVAQNAVGDVSYMFGGRKYGYNESSDMYQIKLNLMNKTTTSD